MASGLVLSGLRSGLHLLRDDLARPVEVLGRLDRMLRETSPGRMLVTLQIAILDAARGELTVANAGHPPLLVIGGRGGPVAIGEPGPPLGTGLHPVYAEVRRPLDAGDTLVLYTDGVAEVQNRRGDQLGAERLAAEVARCARGDSAREVRDGLLSALSNFKGDVDPDDDLTLVVARFTGPVETGTEAAAGAGAAEVREPAAPPAGSAP
jgi:serine phosphatase RsbU (regulator of sigma subunit)